MQISSMSGRTAFKAQIESKSPLINGNWEYLQTPSQQNVTTTPKKSSFMKKAIITLASIGVVAGLLAWGRNTNMIKTVMDKAQTFKAAEGLKEKALWVLGKGGDYVKFGWSKVTSTVTKMFKHAPEVADGTPAPAAPKAPKAPKGVRKPKAPKGTTKAK